MYDDPGRGRPFKELAGEAGSQTIRSRNRSEDQRELNRYVMLDELERRQKMAARAERERRMRMTQQEREREDRLASVPLSEAVRFILEDA